MYMHALSNTQRSLTVVETRRHTGLCRFVATVLRRGLVVGVGVKKRRKVEARVVAHQLVEAALVEDVAVLDHGDEVRLVTAETS